MTAEHRFLSAASAAGSPLAQVQNFARAGYCPQPKQLLFHAACRACDEPSGPTEIGFGGARGPGKSHAMFAQIGLDDCQRFAGLKCLLLRKVGKSLKESTKDLRRKLLRTVPHTYSKVSGNITFTANGSQIILGNFRTLADLDKFIGLEYDLIGIEECTTLQGQTYKLIRSCCRTSKSGWRPRTYSNANPGGIGHQFYLRHFIRGEEGTRFIPATYRDNVFLNQGYLDYLDSLTGWLRRAWRDGDWNIHAGTYFTTFDPKTHVVEPYECDQLGWTFYIAADYGWTHPMAFLLLAKGNQNQIFVVDEYAATKRLPEVHHQMVLEMLAKWKLHSNAVRAFVLGTDAWKPNEQGVTVADTYEELGWDVVQANMSRVPGATELLRRFGDVEAGMVPTLHIFNNCGGLIEQLPSLQHDPHRPEDVLKVDADDEGYGGDDYYDALRYGIMELATQREVTYGPAL